MGAIQNWTTKLLLCAVALLLGLTAAFYAGLNLLAVGNSGLVVQISSELPEAAASVAGNLTSEKSGPKDVERAIALAKRSLRSNPLEATTVVTLALGLNKQQKVDQASRLMRLAAGLTPHYPAPHFWLLDRAMQSRNFEEAAERMDVIFRTRPELVEPILQATNSAGADPDLLRRVTAKLKGDPPWRRQFLWQVSSKFDDPSGAIVVFDVLRSMGSPVSLEELSPLLKRLVAENRPTQAYALWIQAIFREDMTRIDHIYNGSFAQDPAPSPFDWNLTLGSSVSANYEPLAEGPERAIIFEFFDDRHSAFSLSQLLLLAPGEWEFSGRAKPEELTALRGIGWAIYCRPSRAVTVLSQGFRGTSDQWIGFKQSFTVPASGCESQELVMTTQARAEADFDFRGRLSLTALRVSRLRPLEEPPPPAGPVPAP